jgi:exonuclease III
VFLRIPYAIIFCFAVLALQVAGASPASLRIASFNIEWLVATASENNMDPWKDEESLEHHRREIARVLAEKVHADVVCVLESTSKLALEKLVSEPALKPLGYRIYHVESGDDATGQDVAFLSRVPLDRVEGRFVFRVEPKGSKDRLTKHAVIYLHAGKLKLGLLGLHLLAHPEDKRRTSKRMLQAKTADEIIRKEIVARGYVPVVLGDFNDFDPDVAGPEGFPDRRHKVLRVVKDFDKQHDDLELFNAAERIESPAERYSAYWDKNKNDRWDNGEPISMIDHILLDNSLSSRVINTEILHSAHDGSVSDHWPVIVELAR